MWHYERDELHEHLLGVFRTFGENPQLHANCVTHWTDLDRQFLIHSLVMGFVISGYIHRGSPISSWKRFRAICEVASNLLSCTLTFNLACIAPLSKRYAKAVFHQYGSFIRSHHAR